MGAGHFSGRGLGVSGESRVVAVGRFRLDVVFIQRPRALGERQEADAAAPCTRCALKGLHCTLAIIEEGLSVGNYCVQCTIAKNGRCSFKQARLTAAISRGTAIGTGMRSLSAGLRRLGPDGEVLLQTAEEVMQQVLQIFQENVPLAFGAIETALGSTDVISRGAAAAIVNPSSASARSYEAPRSALRTDGVARRRERRTCEFRCRLLTWSPAKRGFGLTAASPAPVNRRVSSRHSRRRIESPPNTQDDPMAGGSGERGSP